MTVQSSAVPDSVQVNFNLLCESIDSLGNVYQLPKTRGRLTKWGPKVFSAAVDGLTGVIAGACTGGLATFCISTACSWAYDEWWDYSMRRGGCTRTGLLTPPLTLKPITNVGMPDTYIYTGGLTNSVDSVGYLHNILLKELQSTGKSYETANGDIDYRGILSDCIKYSEKLGYKIEMDPSMKEKVVSYTKDVVLSFSKLNADITRIDEAYEEVNKSYINNFGGTTKDVERFKNIEQIQKKIFFTLQSIDASALEKEYADKINKIIADSNVDPNLKTDLIKVTSTTVNSHLYWKPLIAK